MLTERYSKHAFANAVLQTEWSVTRTCKPSKIGETIGKQSCAICLRCRRMGWSYVQSKWDVLKIKYRSEWQQYFLQKLIRSWFFGQREFNWQMASFASINCMQMQKIKSKRSSHKTLAKNLTKLLKETKRAKEKRLFLSFSCKRQLNSIFTV